MSRMLKFAVAAASLLFCCGIAQATNPVPNITSLSPPSVYAGGPSFTLTVKGTGFISSTVIYWSSFDPPLTTTYVSNTQVTAQVPAAYITDPTSAYIYAYNPPPGGGDSSSVIFSAIDLDPSINSVSPNAVVAGSGATAITVTGSNFADGATVLWNNKKLPTTYTNSGQLQAQLTASQVAKPEIVQVSVSNPAPGGLSSALNFNVSYPALVRMLNIPANDLVWDRKAQRIYASLPSSFGTNGNSIAVIDPTNGKVTGYHFVGSEPNQLALSADSSYLYVGLNGNGSVQRMILPNFTLDINVSLGSSEYGGLNTASALQVSPGDSHTFAVALGNGECCYGGTLEFFTDTTLLPNSITYPTVSSMQFVSASTLYGYSNDTLIQVAVNSNGGTLTTQWNDTLSNSSTIAYDAGLIYGNSGEVFNPATGELTGDYDVGAGYYGTTNDLLPESAINSVFVVGTTPFFASFGITSYNLTRFTPNAVVNLSQFYGESVTPSSYISWGNNGLAFVAYSGCCGTEYYQTILVQSSMMQPPAGKK
ncbi:MAG: IPT/TIG domain-containing protein [Candidatus Sulfotelmatobacter sp.]